MTALLHDFDLSSAGYRVRIALNLKGVAFERRTYRLRAGEQRAPDYLQLNPAGLVPALEIDGLQLTQSLAIIDYLDRTRPEPPLLPAEPGGRARALAAAQTLAVDVHPLNNLRVLLHLEHGLGLDEAARLAWIARWTAAGLETVEALLAREPPRPFAFGDAPGLFEACLVPQLFHARRYGVDLEPYPRATALAERASALPAFAAAAPAVPV